MNVILFGPPGVGKSAIISQMRELGISAVDLEEVYPADVRYDLPSIARDTIFGAADLDPKANYPGCIKLFLSMPQKRYEERRAARDALYSHKANQKTHLMKDWFTGVTYDGVINVDREAYEVIPHILKVWAMFTSTHARKFSGYIAEKIQVAQNIF